MDLLNNIWVQHSSEQQTPEWQRKKSKKYSLYSIKNMSVQFFVCENSTSISILTENELTVTFVG